MAVGEVGPYGVNMADPKSLIEYCHLGNYFVTVEDDGPEQLQIANRTEAKWRAEFGEGSVVSHKTLYDVEGNRIAAEGLALYVTAESLAQYRKKLWEGGSV